MYCLPSEVQLDIFKYLNFKQLLNFQQTNCYLKNFINEYEEELARKEFYKLDFISTSKTTINHYKLFKPEPEVYDFQLSEQLENKWKWAIEKSIPIFLNANDANRESVICVLEQVHYCKLELEPKREFYNIRLPDYPKTIEDMKIARYFFKQIFNYFFKLANFNFIIFNPQMIELLFDENKTKISLQIHSQKAALHINNNHTELFLQFALKHLISKQFNIYFRELNGIDQHLDILFKIVTTRGKKFVYVNYLFSYFSRLYYNRLIQHIETSKNISKIVQLIKFGGVRGPLTLSEQAENIEIKVKSNNLNSTKYQLSNKYNPEMKFSVFIDEVYRFDENIAIYNVKIERNM